MIGQEVRIVCVLCGAAGPQCQTTYRFKNDRILAIDKPHGRAVREIWKVVFREMGWVELESAADQSRTWAREEHVVRIPPSERARRQKQRRSQPGEGVPVYRRRRAAG
jgi:hypothetical protein